jgi:hypothetical protein
MSPLFLPLPAITYAGNSQAITTYVNPRYTQTGGVLLVDERLIGKEPDKGSGPALHHDPDVAESAHPHPSAAADAGVVANHRLTDDLGQLADLVTRGELAGAWEMVQDMERRWPGDEQVRRFARVLAPPTISVRKGSTARPRRQEYRWLREHSREYPGCWLAVFRDSLIAASPDVKVVVEAIRQDPSARGALLHFEPEV